MFWCSVNLNSHNTVNEFNQESKSKSWFENRCGNIKHDVDYPVEGVKLILNIITAANKVKRVGKRKETRR